MARIQVMVFQTDQFSELENYAKSIEDERPSEAISLYKILRKALVAHADIQTEEELKIKEAKSSNTLKTRKK